MGYQLMYNNAAGEHRIILCSKEDVDNWEVSGYRLQKGYFSEVGLYETEAELEEAIEELRGPVVYAVFENRPAGEGFISEEDNLTGNWRGNKYGYSSLIAEFPARKAAEKAYPQFA